MPFTLLLQELEKIHPDRKDLILQLHEAAAKLLIHVSQPGASVLHTQKTEQNQLMNLLGRIEDLALLNAALNRRGEGLAVTDTGRVVYGLNAANAMDWVVSRLHQSEYGKHSEALRLFVDIQSVLSNSIHLNVSSVLRNILKMIKHVLDSNRIPPLPEGGIANKEVVRYLTRKEAAHYLGYDDPRRLDWFVKTGLLKRYRVCGKRFLYNTTDLDRVKKTFVSERLPILKDSVTRK